MRANTPTSMLRHQLCQHIKVLSVYDWYIKTHTQMWAQQINLMWAICVSMWCSKCQQHLYQHVTIHVESLLKSRHVILHFDTNIMSTPSTLCWHSKYISTQSYCMLTYDACQLRTHTYWVAWDILTHDTAFWHSHDFNTCNAVLTLNYVDLSKLCWYSSYVSNTCFHILSCTATFPDATYICYLLGRRIPQIYLRGL